jgi:hypothetical protein
MTALEAQPEICGNSLFSWRKKKKTHKAGQDTKWKFLGAHTKEPKKKTQECALTIALL